jgi:hypothetical protein
MACDHVKLPGPLAGAIVCSRGRQGSRRCCACYLAGGFQCDWKVSDTKTCDAFICAEHAQKVADDKHLCPAHQETYKAWLAKRKRKEKTA